MSKLIINVNISSGFNCHNALIDIHVKPFCINILEQLRKGEGDIIYTAQELVLYMFRALIYKDYKDLQSKIVFRFEGVEVKFDKNMRTIIEYPYSVYDECCNTLLGLND